MTVPLVRCPELPMFEGHPLIVTAQLDASQVELTSYINGAFFDLTASQLPNNSTNKIYEQIIHTISFLMSSQMPLSSRASL